MTSAVQHFGQDSCRNGEKRVRSGLLDAVVSHLIVEAGAADLKEFGCLYAVPLCVGKSLNDACTFRLLPGVTRYGTEIRYR